ncbi:hypothetical protein CEXT_244461 [Caerostris extrusa]|uniref:Uncharacterized protein n=1 Tax=Caerostris extrusa TaxID=172846 RepID=A0AAV4VIV8_CAEEX|nr:hypothetical protein CEXT_244461 [Caerostris extrusa]
MEEEEGGKSSHTRKLRLANQLISTWRCKTDYESRPLPLQHVDDLIRAHSLAIRISSWVIRQACCETEVEKARKKERDAQQQQQKTVAREMTQPKRVSITRGDRSEMVQCIRLHSREHLRQEMLRSGSRN